MKFLIWTTIGYILLWGITCGFLVAMDKGWIHKSGCRICFRYGELCGCGYAKKKSIKLMDMIKYLADNGNDWSWQGITFVVLVPIFLIGLFVVTHIVNPLHRRKCLADILNSPVQEN